MVQIQPPRPTSQALFGGLFYCERAGWKTVLLICFCIAVRRSRAPKPKAAYVLGKGGRFEVIPEYPEFAWFEGLVNAFAHRNYAFSGDYIRVTMYDDRLEMQCLCAADAREQRDLARVAPARQSGGVCGYRRVGGTERVRGRSHAGGHVEGARDY